MSKLARVPAQLATTIERARAAKLGRNVPETRKDSGTKDTAFRGRRKAKRVHMRKLQRQARRVQR